MYYYLLYLLGYHTYEDESEQVRMLTEQNVVTLDSRTPIFPSGITIIKNRDLIIDKEQLRSGYKNVVEELKERIKNNPNMVKN